MVFFAFFRSFLLEMDFCKSILNRFLSSWLLYCSSSSGDYEKYIFCGVWCQETCQNFKTKPKTFEKVTFWSFLLFFRSFLLEMDFCKSILNRFLSSWLLSCSPSSVDYEKYIFCGGLVPRNLSKLQNKT